MHRHVIFHSFWHHQNYYFLKNFKRLNIKYLGILFQKGLYIAEGLPKVKICCLHYFCYNIKHHCQSSLLKKNIKFRVYSFRELESIMGGSMNTWELTSWFADRRQRERRAQEWLWVIKVCSQWHTSSKRTSPPNPS